MYHPELGKRILDRIAEQMEGIAKVEAEPRLDGRNMIMVLAPDKRARQSQAARSAAVPAEPAPPDRRGGRGRGQGSADPARPAPGIREREG